MNKTIEVLNSILLETSNRLKRYEETNITYDEELEKSIEEYENNVFALIDILDKVDNKTFEPEVLKVFNQIKGVLVASKDNTILPLAKESEKTIRDNNMISSYINTIKHELSRQKEFSKLRDKYNQIQTLINRIDNLKQKEYFEDIKELVDILFNMKNLDIKTYSKVLEEINIHNIEASNIKASELKINQSKTKTYTLTIDELKEVFNTHKQVFENENYDLDLVNKDIVDKLLVNGNLENIECVFQFYERIGLTFDITKRKNEKYLVLLYKTNEEIINTVETICKNNGFDIEKVLMRVSAFINNSNGTIIKGDGDSTIPKLYLGAHDDFVQNVEYLKSIGYTSKELNSCISILSYPNKQIRENIKAYKLYGIDIEKITDTFKLSGLKNSDPLFTVDQFIELGEFPYLLTNTSAFGYYRPNCINFYRIYKKQKEGKEYREMNKDGVTYHYVGEINDTKKDNEYLSTHSDKKKETGTIEVKIFDEQTNSVIEDIINNSPSYYNPTIKDNEIVKLLDEKFGVPDDLKVYKVEGKVYSRLKVLRLLSMLENKIDLDKSELTLFCLTYNTIMTQQELEIARNSIMELTKGLK